MRRLAMLLVATWACGCATGKREGVSVLDRLDAVKIDQMVGNAISGEVFERTIVCLNARRETHWVTAMTNQAVVALTNISLSYVTNLTFTLTTNQQQTLATNLVAALPAPTGDTNSESATGAVAPLPGSSTNIAVTTASNVTLSRAGNQTSTSANFQTQRTRQVTAMEQNKSITTADNQIVTAETNLVVTVFTNVVVTSVTNSIVSVTNAPIIDHFLVLEYTPPPDFSLATGESLVLLVDGERHVMSTGTTQSVLAPRKGFSAVAYKATPQLLVDIANAREVQVRIKGTSQVIERCMNRGSRENLKKFLVKYFAAPELEGKNTASVSSQTLKPEDS